MDKKRLLIVVWRWYKSEDVEDFCDFIGEGYKFEVKIENTSDCLFCGFTKKDARYEYTTQDIIEYINSKSDYKALLLLHGGTPDKFTEEMVNNSFMGKFTCEEPTIKIFSGSNTNRVESPIYSKLVDEGLFRDSAVKNSKDQVNFSLKKEIFDDIWNYYVHSLKQKIYEFREEVIIENFNNISEFPESEFKNYRDKINKFIEYYKSISNKKDDEFIRSCNTVIDYLQPDKDKDVSCFLNMINKCLRNIEGPIYD